MAGLALRILQWLGIKAILIVLIAAGITAAAFAVNWFEANRISTDQVAALEREVGRLQAAVIAQGGLADEAQRTVAAVAAQKPSWLWEPLRRMRWQVRYEAARAAAAEAAERLTDLRERLGAAETDLLRSRERISAAYAGLIHAYRQTRPLIAMAVLLALIGPPLWKLLWFFAVAPLAAFAAPLRLLDGPVSGGGIRIGPSEKACVMPILPGDNLIARMDWVQQYTPGARKKTRFLWRWDAPLISLAAGLVEMTEVQAARTDGLDRVVLGSGRDPDRFLCRIDLEAHPGLVLRPRAVVAVTDDVTVRTRWNVLSLHGWIAGTLRQVLFCGSGSIVLCGYGGIRTIDPSEGCRIEEVLVLGFEGTTDVATARTETFWPYFRGMTSLFDARFDGTGRVLVQQALAPDQRRSANPFRRAVDGLLGGLGKLLGL